MLQQKLSKRRIYVWLMFRDFSSTERYMYMALFDKSKFRCVTFEVITYISNNYIFSGITYNNAK